MDSPQWELISDSAKDLIQQMLTVDPKQRITIQEVLNHRWLRVIMEEFRGDKYVPTRALGFVPGSR